LHLPTNMTPHNVLLFTSRAASLAGHRMRARPADLIPLQPRRRGHDRFTTKLFVFTAILVWAGAIVLALTDLRFNHVGMGDLFPGWQGWPIW